MPGRDRYQYLTRPKGQYTRFGVDWIPPGEQTLSAVNSCADVTGPGDNAGLIVNHITRSGGVYNRRSVDGYYDPGFSNYVLDVFDNSSDFDHIFVPGSPLNVEAATIGAARTNPSRPYVDIPVNLLELGDIARTWRSVADFHRRQSARTAGGLNLGYNFGIAPLVGDLVKLTRFQDQVNRRVGEIERLKTKGLRKTVPVFSGAATAQYHRVFQSSGIYYENTFSGITTEMIKVHCRWLPTDVPAISTPTRMYDLARRAVLGMTVDFSTAWEVMPWSWLVDWCSTMGDYISSQRNIIPAILNDVSIMRHTRTEYTHPGASGANDSLTASYCKRETKRRASSFVAPTAHFPFLSGNQMGILASLAVTRR